MGRATPQCAFEGPAALEQALEVLTQLGRLGPLACPVEAFINGRPVLQRRLERLLQQTGAGSRPGMVDDADKGAVGPLSGQ